MRPFNHRAEPTTPISTIEEWTLHEAIRASASAGGAEAVAVAAAWNGPGSSGVIVAGVTRCYEHAGEQRIIHAEEAALVVALAEYNHVLAVGFSAVSNQANHTPPQSVVETIRRLRDMIVSLGPGKTLAPHAKLLWRDSTGQQRSCHARDIP